MTTLEFLLGFAYNMRGGFGFVATLSCLITIILIPVNFCVHCEDKDPATPAQKKMVRRMWAFFFLTTLFCYIPTCIPDVQDLWKIRIGMIKLQLASPENVEKGAAEIVRIGKKLECRYLGCDEEKK